MEFSIETVYDAKAVRAMCRGLRKTLRAKRSRRSHILGWTAAALALMLNLGRPIDFRSALTWAAMAAVILALLFEDRINGYIARKRAVPGTERAFTVFREDGYSSETSIGKTEF